ncbi:MAG: hypothetical protein P0Y58_26730 [Candidatus Pseudomonas phytovorans]|uniref:Type IV pilus assembly protein PilX n=1 Tax=Candidatus Pseudomonas phytovorans TaxID=3121377 RepID=A0AAJ6BC59_9PSED|nr:hypothetical protein [Pseudomonas sp.]WEK30439.1 MAG: hypothetical protein P0Y58_26730 [Pseudomonas sp.]
MKCQRGVVLLSALVLSLLLGLLATSALSNALMETRMTGYMRDGLLALEEAEAALQAGESELKRATPDLCTACMPPARSHDLAGQWQGTQDGYFHLQNLGPSKRAQATLFRVTAVSKQTQSRHVLEAVYAVADGTTRRVSWRQILRGD